MLPLTGKLDRDVALLDRADEGAWLGEARHDAFDDEEALVEHEGDAAVLLLDEHPELLGAVAAADLLVVPKGEQHGPRRLEAALEKALDRLQLAYDVVLVVDRAAAPHGAVRVDHARERLVEPLAQVRLFHRHDVEVGAEHDGVEPLGVALGRAPLVEQRVVVDHG